MELSHYTPLKEAEKTEDEEVTEETLSSRLSRHGRKTDPIVELLNRVRDQKSIVDTKIPFEGSRSKRSHSARNR